MSADLIAKSQLAKAYEKESFKLYHRRRRWWYSPARRVAIDGLWRDCCDRARQLNDEIRELQEGSK